MHYIEGVSGADNIAELWRQHSALFNSVNSDPFEVGNIAKRDTLGITINEILSDNRACGSDHITAEHLKYASPKVAALLAFCFNGFMTHGMLPNSMLAFILVPVTKDKAGKVGSMENYGPIALASVLSKVLERIV